MTDYVEWLEARIADAKQSGELHLLDPMSIARAWAERES